MDESKENEGIIKMVFDEKGEVKKLSLDTVASNAILSYFHKCLLEDDIKPSKRSDKDFFDFLREYFWDMIDDAVSEWIAINYED